MAELERLARLDGFGTGGIIHHISGANFPKITEAATNAPERQDYQRLHAIGYGCGGIGAGMGNIPIMSK